MSKCVLLWALLSGLSFCVFGQGAIRPIEGQVNTPNDETAPFQYGGRVYFTSMVNQVEKDAVRRIYSTNGKCATQANINPKSALSHASDMTLSSDAKRMYYSVCKGEDCSIWVRERNYEGDWAAGSKLPAPINKRGISNLQPTVGFDQILKKYVLYFSSDRTGGSGGMDIWQSVIETDYETGEISFGQPVPLPFNSIYDEVTPFFHMASQTLFFSSDGLPGLGGQDVFWIRKNKDGDWDRFENAGRSLNSDADDMHYSFHTSSQKGYLSSNRGERGDFDIYEVLPKVDLQISCIDIHSDNPVNHSVAEVFDESSGHSAIVHQQPFDDHLSASLMPGKHYRIAVLAEGYSPQLLVIETGERQLPSTLRREVRLFRDGDEYGENREVPGGIFPTQDNSGEEKTNDLPTAREVKNSEG